MATINAINNRTQELTVDPEVSGDSFVQFDINGTGEFRIGIDDDATDPFKISQGSALGANDTFIMTADGERTMPLQPCFLAYNSTTDVNQTGDGNIATVEFDTEVFDIGGNYDNSTDTFTAPVTGMYSLRSIVRVGNTTSNAAAIQFQTSNRIHRFGSINPNAQEDSSSNLQCYASVLADMDAADTVYVFVVAYNAGADNMSFYGAAGMWTYFSGKLEN